jgi:hypothetical protein
MMWPALRVAIIFGSVRHPRARLDWGSVSTLEHPRRAWVRQTRIAAALRTRTPLRSRLIMGWPPSAGRGARRAWEGRRAGVLGSSCFVRAAPPTVAHLSARYDRSGFTSGRRSTSISGARVRRQAGSPFRPSQEGSLAPIVENLRFPAAGPPREGPDGQRCQGDNRSAPRARFSWRSRQAARAPPGPELADSTPPGREPQTATAIRASRAEGRPARGGRVDRRKAY